jgi:GT2 family glycosyltransferase/SAM-dependent methyltransferase
MEFTGERYVPNLDWPEISYEHWHRYLFASQFVAGKKVLDIACGEGYGASLLAATARTVVGVDLEPETIEHAANTYRRPNLEFRCGSADAIPVEGEAVFDVVVSFETIEHLDADAQVMFGREMKRLLNPSGIVIVSTPNKQVYSDDHQYENPFHLHELYGDEFLDFLKGLFSSVHLLGQRAYPGSCVWPLDGALRQVTEYQLAFTDEGFAPVSDDQKAAYYLLAVCSDADIETPSGSILLDLSERATTVRSHQLEAKEREVQELRGLQAEQEDQTAADCYQRIVGRIRRLVRTVVPAGETVMVVSKGDEALLQLGKHRAWHFPQAENGDYAGHYPESAGAAIIHMEALRAKGAAYLVFPTPAFWWFEHYAGLKQHLERKHRRVLHHDETCAIYDLHAATADGNANPQATLDHVIAEYQQRFDAAPAILDWNTGLNLAATFPEYAIFSPPTADPVLPYLDDTVDIVVAPANAVAEAHRVARAAVVTSTSTADADPASVVTTDWKLAAPAVPLPTTSIIIPSYNSIGYTETCLTALGATLPPEFDGEIIVVDDASTDDTPEVLRRLAKRDHRLRVIRNRENLGFIGTCNRGAKAAAGEFLVFLNNDTVPVDGWLQALLRTFHDYPDAGAVGGKLVYPDGRLQEAGAVIFRDGSGANFGKWSPDPDAPLFNHVREVDYCSGALLATKRALFFDIGGFDTRYRPAYYEDTDFCFSVRAAGYRVYYQPESVVIHFEGAVHGTDVSTGVKRYQAVNRDKFVAKWRDVLDQQLPPPSRFDLATWHALATHGRATEIGR